ncbi:MAG: Mth938-like domain-containing protein [Alphaproteobacteria bacterium]|nr:Mth938-like domain-containing protein [Alphaproteobacteria bacterium]
MSFAPSTYPGRRLPIDAYGDGGFRVGGVFHEGALLLLPSGATRWAVSGNDGLAAAPLEALLAEAAGIELLIVGTGVETRPLPAEMARALEAGGLRFEAMSTGAAARTFNVLLSEDRRVAAALLAVD